MRGVSLDGRSELEGRKVMDWPAVDLIRLVTGMRLRRPTRRVIRGSAGKSYRADTTPLGMPSQHLEEVRPKPG